MYCKKCGAPNPDTAKFCCRCGQPIETERSAPAQRGQDGGSENPDKTDATEKSAGKNEGTAEKNTWVIKWALSIGIGLLLSYVVSRILGKQLDGMTEKDFNMSTLIMLFIVYVVLILIAISRPLSSFIHNKTLSGVCTVGGAVLLWISTASLSLSTGDREVYIGSELAKYVIERYFLGVNLTGWFIVQSILFVAVILGLINFFSRKDK